MNAKKAFKKMTPEERTAWRALFRGAFFNVKKFSDREWVFWGTTECEWVPFDEFWLTKVPELGLATIEKDGPRECAKEGVTVTDYTFRPTDLGLEVKEMY